MYLALLSCLRLRTIQRALVGDVPKFDKIQLKAFAIRKVVLYKHNTSPGFDQVEIRTIRKSNLSHNILLPAGV